MNTKEKLEKLIKRNEELSSLIFKNYKSESELIDYRIKNYDIFKEYQYNQTEIDQLKYELMTPEEREEYDEYMRKLKLKSEGKKFW